MKRFFQSDAARSELLESAIKRAPIGLIIQRLEREGDMGSLRQLFANEAADEATGQKLSQDDGKTWSEVSPDLADSPFGRIYEGILETGEPATWEMEYGDSRFAPKWWRGSAQRIAPNTLLTAFQNVTAEVQVREQLKAERERLAIAVANLERSNKELDDFAYVASHDLKAPLRDVQNLANWIREDAAASLPPASLRHFEVLEQRLLRMEKLLDDLLEYSRAGRKFEAAAPFRLDQLLEEILGLVPPPPGFTIHLPATDLEFDTPRVPLRHIIQNLVGNALKHHDREQGSISVEAKLEGSCVRIEVADDGPGIPESSQKKVFDLFTTLRSRDDVEGSGVGLAIVKKTVEAFGGSIRIQSPGERGCVVSFTWPLNWSAGE